MAVSSRGQLHDFLKYKESDEIVSDVFSFHLSFRPAVKDVRAILAKNPETKFIHLAFSNRETLSKRAEKLLKEKGIQILQGLEFWGKKADSDGFYSIDLNKALGLSKRYESGELSLVGLRGVISNRLDIGAELTDYIIRTEILQNMSQEAFEKLSLIGGVD
jgi:plasmid maintenance system killer protein